jgi:hypothetical protein
MFKEEPIATHWEGCEEVHPECKIAKLNRRIAELEIMLENNGWISTTKNLPEIGKPVLLMTSDGYVFIGYRESDERWIACAGCYGDYLSEFRWLPDPFPSLSNDGLVAYWYKVPFPPKDIIPHLSKLLWKVSRCAKALVRLKTSYLIISLKQSLEKSFLRCVKLT